MPPTWARRVIAGPDGRVLHDETVPNLITTAGDQYYAGKAAAGVAPAAPAAPTNADPSYEGGAKKLQNIRFEQCTIGGTPITSKPSGWTVTNADVTYVG